MEREENIRKKKKKRRVKTGYDNNVVLVKMVGFTRNEFSRCYNLSLFLLL